MIHIDSYNMLISVYTVISIMVLLSTILPARSFKELYKAMLITILWPVLPIYILYVVIIDWYRGKDI